VANPVTNSAAKTPVLPGADAGWVAVTRDKEQPAFAKSLSTDPFTIKLLQSCQDTGKTFWRRKTAPYISIPSSASPRNLLEGCEADPPSPGSGAAGDHREVE
jgi:hypothetical protein